MRLLDTMKSNHEAMIKEALAKFLWGIAKKPVTNLFRGLGIWDAHETAKGITQLSRSGRAEGLRAAGLTENRLVQNTLSHT